METTNIVDFARRDGTTDTLTDLLRTGAQPLIATAVEAELADYLAQFTDLRTGAGHAAVHCPAGYCAAMSREGAQRASSGPTISNRHWSCERAHSEGSIQGRHTRDIPLRPIVRRTKTLEAALPWLYLKGISSGETGAALKVFLGPDAAGLSANTVSRLKRDGAREYDGWKEAEPDDEALVYIRAPSRQHASHAPAGQRTVFTAACGVRTTSSVPL